jgi:hypothetical protein
MPIIIAPKGRNPYDLVVGSLTRQTPRITVLSLAAQFPDDFRKAASALEADEWRLLYEIKYYEIYALANPAFDPLQSIEEVLDHQQTIEGVLVDRVCSNRSIEEIAFGIRMKLSALSFDERKALWCILVGAKHADLDNDELASCGWWRYWIRT